MTSSTWLALGGVIAFAVLFGFALIVTAAAELVSDIMEQHDSRDGTRW